MFTVDVKQQHNNNNKNNWKFEILKRILTINLVLTPTPNVIRSFSLRRVSNVCKQLTSLLASCLSCLSPWARQNFPAPLKIEKKLCLIAKKMFECVCCDNSCSPFHFGREYWHWQRNTSFNGRLSKLHKMVIN